MPSPTTTAPFVHQALMYAGDDQYLAATVPFVLNGLDGGEPVMVAVPDRQLGLLRDALGEAAGEVLLVDMDQLGQNPARIIPAWLEFVAQRAPGHRPARGIGEPVGPDRSTAHLLEAQRHEVLLDSAFAGRPDFWLLCPYDTDHLAPAVIGEAARSHRFVSQGSGPHRRSEGYDPGDPPGFNLPLPEPDGPTDELAFGLDSLVNVRLFTTGAVLRHGLPLERLSDALVAVNELATNSVCHGGGRGRLRVWRELAHVVCEVSDDGVINEPLAGRRHPDSHREGGRGLWIVNQLADLVELRSGPGGTVVRVHL